MGLKGLLFSNANDATPPRKTNVVAMPMPAAIGGGDVDAGVRRLLERDLAQHCAYADYAAMSQSLASVLPDDRQRVEVVLAALVGKGTTATAVVAAIDACNELIEKRQAEADEAASAARADRVGARQRELEAVQAQLAQLDARRTKLRAEIDAEARDIDDTARRFRATALQMRAALDAHRQHITTTRGGRS